MKKSQALLLLSASLVAISGAARAAEGTANTPSGAQGVTSLEEVVVTAQKRAENLQEVPVAISAYTAETRQIVGINTVQDLSNFTPGLSYSASTDRVFIRGIGRQTNTNGSDPGVATYTDGVYDASTASVGASDFFINRVEVLRGPQGTLYGRNSIGGAINAISKRPTKDFSGEVRATVGDYGLFNFEGAVSGPLTQGLTARLAGARYSQTDGYFKNDAGGPSEGGAGTQNYVELQLQADLAPSVNAWLKVFTRSSDNRGRSANSNGPYDYALYPTGFIAPGSAFGYTTTGFASTGPSTNPGQTNLREFNTDTPSRSRLRDNVGVAGDMTWSLPGVDIRYTGGFQRYTYNATSDIDGTSVTSYTVPLAPGFSICAAFIPGCTATTVAPSQAFNYLEDKAFGSSELDFSSSGSGPVQWIAGAYYYGEKQKQESHFNAPNLVQLRTPANGPADPSGDFVYAASTLRTRSSGVFGQVDWKVTDTIKLTGGLRYSHDEKSGFEALRVVCFGCGGFSPAQYGTSTPALDVTASSVSSTPAPGVSSAVTIDPATGIARRDLSASWSATTGTAGVEWTPDRDTLAYFKYSRGYKSGGFNAGGITPLPETQPEHIDAFEIGLKRDFGSRLQVNAAIYDYRYEGLQVPLTVTTAAGINLTEFFNLDRSTAYGAELEAVWRPIDPLRLMLSYGYAHSRIDKACCFVDGADPQAVQPGAQPSGGLVGGQQPQNLVGQRLPSSPENKVALNASYDFNFSTGRLTLSGSYIWSDTTYSGVFNRGYTLTPAYDQVDLRVVWTATKHYRVIAYVRNVFDKQGYSTASGTLLASPPAALNQVTTSYGLNPPRTFGLQLQYSFN